MAKCVIICMETEATMEEKVRGQKSVADGMKVMNTTQSETVHRQTSRNSQCPAQPRDAT